MKNIFPPFAKLVAIAACALTLGSCSRSEYAMLPQGSSYHGVTRVATPVPTAATPAPATAAIAAEASTAVAAASVAAATPATKPVAKAAARVAAPAVAPSALGTAATAEAAPAPKLNVLQRIALNKVARKMDKLVQKSGSARQHDNTASTTRGGGISGNLRIGIILLLVGLLVGILNGLIGTIIAIIGLIFIILWLLDQM